jgi:PAS domain S-box-containing protein
VNNVANILFIEDLEEDYVLMLRHLSKSKLKFSSLRVDNMKDLERELHSREFDLFVLDYDIPGYTIDQFLVALSGYNAEIPIVVVSGTMIEDQVATALQYGARDYVMKDNLRRLSNTVLKEVTGYRDRVKFNQSHAERLQIEGALYSSEKKFQMLVENSSDIFTMIDGIGKIIYVSPTVEQILGYAQKENTGKNIFEFIHPEDNSIVNDVFNSNLHVTGISPSVKYRYKHKDGSYRQLESKANNLINDPDINAIIVNSRDITDRLEVEKLIELHRSAQEKLYKSTFGYLTLKEDQNIFDYVGKTLSDLIPNAIISINEFEPVQGQIRVKTVHGFDKFVSYLPEIVKKMTVNNVFEADDDAIFILKNSNLAHVDGGLYQLFFKKFPKQICEFVEKKIGVKEILTMGFISDKDLLGNAVIIILEDTPSFNEQIIETFINVAAVAIKNQLNDERIRNSLTEKEVLLKEIHHRVKNNLQIISSLLELQSIQIKSEETKTLFKDSQSRVKSMALVHERIYQSDDLSSINYKEYIVELADFLFYTYDKANVNYTLDADDVRMSIDNAIPCGIIINELISNALKHAFPNGRPGHVKISLKKNRKEIILKIMDDGIGMKSGVDIKKSKSLGLELINALVQQLNGQISVTSEKGTSFSIRIPN